MHTVLLDLICLYSVMWPSLLKANYALHMSCLSKLYCYLSGELKVVERPQSVGLLPVQGWKMASKNLGFRFKKPKTSKVQNLSFLKGFLIFGEICCLCRAGKWLRKTQVLGFKNLKPRKSKI